MARVTIPELERTIEDPDEIREFLAANGVDYWRAAPDVPVPSDAPAEALLEAYKARIDELSAQGGYVTADVIDVFPNTPGLDAMLNKFSAEHWHDEDEVRFIIEGRGVFHVHPPGQPVFAIEVGPGDLIRVPQGTHHWFDLCADRRIRAIRLFKDKAGWAPRYTETGIDQQFQPLCFGPAYLPPSLARS
ncbi:MAG: cupin domain-containing protein [Acidobacteria bacterium]|nr:cupin domain-containing protein [Acidobacteriota bacterium]